MSLFVDDVAFWDELYKDNNDGWDLKTPNPVFTNIISGNKFISPCKLLITGSGKGYDAIAAAKNGYEVTAVDFSTYATDFAIDTALKEGVSIKFLREDIFFLSDEYENKFDAVYEYTTFCAINPARREEFIKKITSTIKINGRFIVLLFPVDGRKGGPPFSVDITGFYNIAKKYLKLEYFLRNINSVKPRKGKEVLFIFKRTEV